MFDDASFSAFILDLAQSKNLADVFKPLFCRIGRDDDLNERNHRWPFLDGQAIVSRIAQPHFYGLVSVGLVDANPAFGFTTLKFILATISKADLSYDAPKTIAMSAIFFDADMLNWNWRFHHAAMARWL